MKTNKSFTKRLKVTKKGKLIARSKGQNHYNSMENRKTKTTKRQTGEFEMSNKARDRFLPHA